MADCAPHADTQGGAGRCDPEATVNANATERNLNADTGAQTVSEMWMSSLRGRSVAVGPVSTASLAGAKAHEQAATIPIATAGG